ncbi:Tetratricopeptide repeat protein [Vibrio crassostreae]|uniref:tetratricopeptide repeat protein n=1 Tax=Vibrio crassostreae TaxID=246167 RepID=UPI001B3070E7|nr:tetratricopeptide repeat protein [Vibrio crassostreae]CAK2053836.1 Tetratricopeptide repeat protein [Vibrio crassostreae]CAK2057493.1 Tetratricopeptide repeat protein [Vibrio crassostreae]CAK2057796.1 Tetratricopeptide repeat protein [Vibrio crassostreae]CAK2061552.1 Tetratricopeptide repeat protein [Vibrio crassostreae]CAK2061940.1 Tetratricopeptide repeat protein [Vibrio crassostreae]
MMLYNKFLLLLLPILLLGCASSDEPTNQFDAELYSGKPIDSLTSDDPPLNEKEAIMRGDIALRDSNIDLALYEYIRSLSFPEKEFHDKTLFTIGQIHSSRGNYALAEKAYLAALDFNPAHTEVLEQLGVLYTKQRLTDEGRSYFFKAINSDQVRLKSSETIQNYQALSQSEVASLKVDSMSPALAYMGIGVLEDVDGKHQIAQEYFKKSLTIDKSSVKALLNMGYSHYMYGNYKEAYQYTRSALELDPNNEKAQNNLALIYLASGDIKKATNVFMRHMEAPEALNNVGYFLILQGKPDQAVPYLQQAINKKSSYYKVANENLNRALAEVREMEQ